MMIGSRLLGVLVGPVNVWNTTWHTPSSSDIAGYYKLPKGSARGISERSGFRLTADHRVEVIDVPAFDGFGERIRCNYNGTGTWNAIENGGVQLILSIDTLPQVTPEKPASCGPASLGGFELLGHSTPYRIWYGIGDPEGGTGLTYVRQYP